MFTISYHALGFFACRLPWHLGQQEDCTKHVYHRLMLGQGLNVCGVKSLDADVAKIVQILLTQ